jgi:hypothetical protein
VCLAVYVYVCVAVYENVCLWLCVLVSWSQFFIRSLLVPPNKFRPPQRGLTGDGVFEHVQNMFYTKVVNLNGSLVSAGVAAAASKAAEGEDDDGKLPGTRMSTAPAPTLSATTPACCADRISDRCRMQSCDLSTSPR